MLIIDKHENNYNKLANNYNKPVNNYYWFIGLQLLFFFYYIQDSIHLQLCMKI